MVLMKNMWKRSGLQWFSYSLTLIICIGVIVFTLNNDALYKQTIAKVTHMEVISKESTTEEKEVARVVKRHRLIECFLIETLGYRWDEVHIEAEVLEHRVSDLFIERLDEMLSYPKYCPHGALIPRGSLQEETLHAIIELNTGDSFTLSKVRDEVRLLSYLYENDIKINDTLVIQSIDEANHIMYLNKNDQLVSLSMENAKKLYYK